MHIISTIYHYSFESQKSSEKGKKENPEMYNSFKKKNL